MAKVRNDNVLLCIAQVLKELREERGMSQEQVYNDTDVHVGRIEATNLNLTIMTLSKLLSFFGVSFSEFFRRVEEKTIPFSRK